MFCRGVERIKADRPHNDAGSSLGGQSATKRDKARQTRTKVDEITLPTAKPAHFGSPDRFPPPQFRPVRHHQASGSDQESRSLGFVRPENLAPAIKKAGKGGQSRTICVCAHPVRTQFATFRPPFAERGCPPPQRVQIARDGRSRRKVQMRQCAKRPRYPFSLASKFGRAALGTAALRFSPSFHADHWTFGPGHSPFHSDLILSWPLSSHRGLDKDCPTPMKSSQDQEGRDRSLISSKPAGAFRILRAVFTRAATVA